jgi:ankyrin repeat domain-containing protein 50
MGPHDTERKWKRLRTIFRPSTDKARGSNPTLGTVPTLTEPADQTAESPPTGKQIQNIQVGDLRANAPQTFSGKDKATILQSSSVFQACSDSNPGIVTAPANQTAESPSTGKRDQNVQVRGLWADALKTLSDQDQAAFQAHSDSDLGRLLHLRAIAEQKRDDCEKRGWKFKLNGREIILRDLAQKIIVWIDKFKEVGDIAANFDPVHVALPWAGIRFLLQVRVESALPK